MISSPTLSPLDYRLQLPEMMENVWYLCTLVITADVRQPWTDLHDHCFEYLIIRFYYLIIPFDYLIIG